MDENSPLYRLYVCSLAGVALTVFIMLSIVGFKFITRFDTAIAYVLWAVFILATLMLLVWLGLFLFLDIKKRAIKNELLKQDVKVVSTIPKLSHQPYNNPAFIVEKTEDLKSLREFTWNKLAIEIYGKSGSHNTLKLKKALKEEGYNVTKMPPVMLADEEDDYSENFAPYIRYKNGH